MSRMNMPRFTAELALSSSQGGYRTCIQMAPTPQVIPQRINQACWLRAFIRTSFRCVNAGYSSDQCAQVAGDLADSVCDF
jgi:hypothetical protein